MGSVLFRTQNKIFDLLPLTTYEAEDLAQIGAFKEGKCNRIFHCVVTTVRILLVIHVSCC